MITVVRGEATKTKWRVRLGQRHHVPKGAGKERTGTFVPHSRYIRQVCFGPLSCLISSVLNRREGEAMGLVQDHQRIVDAFVEVATTPLLAGLDDGAQAILGVCCDVLGVDGGVMIDQDIHDRHLLVASTDRSLTEIFGSRHSHGMKGIRECVRGAVSISREIPREGFVIDPLVKQLSANGFRHEHFLPMRLQGRPIGALAIFDRRHETLDPADLLVAQGLADSSAAVLDGARSLSEATLVIAQLRGALDSRVVIEQAKGIVAERLNVDVVAAFEHLRRSSRSQRRALNELCIEVVNTRNLPDPLLVHQDFDNRKQVTNRRNVDNRGSSS